MEERCKQPQQQNSSQEEESFLHSKLVPSSIFSPAESHRNRMSHINADAKDLIKELARLHHRGMCTELYTCNIFVWLIDPIARVSI